MVNFKNLLFILCFIFFHNSIAQEDKEFFVEIQNNNYIPKVSHTFEREKINVTKTGDKKLDNLINSYEIYSVKRVFKNSSRASLQNIYLISCNDIQLMDDLSINYSQYYFRVEDANGVPLHVPNDFGTTGGYLGDDQDELTYIRAQEAWDISKGSSKIIIGIADGNFQPLHEDLINTFDLVVNAANNNPNSSGVNQHGSIVASMAAADTNNNKGISAIGYNSFMYGGTGLNASVLDDLSLFEGVKVLNASWYSQVSSTPINEISTEVYDEIINDRKIAVIVAAGNGQFTGHGNPNDYYYPASYKDIISVSSIGHENKTWGLEESFIDTHEFINDGVLVSHQHNDSIDIVAPGYAVPSVAPSFGGGFDVYYNTQSGTSFAAPMVAGTVALMFDVNYCLEPKEVETILKLTAVKIDNLPQNIQYYGKLGAGKLDAYEAVKMAKDMADEYGTVEVKDRVLYRNWFYKIERAPYEIKMTNNDVTGKSRLKFRARNNIEILSGDYYPDSGGYVDLQINPDLELNNCPPPPENTQRNSSNNNLTFKDGLIKRFAVYPTLVAEKLTISQIDNGSKEMNKVEIYDFFGKLILEKNKIDSKELKLNIQFLKPGIHMVKIYGEDSEVLQITKIVKK